MVATILIPSQKTSERLDTVRHCGLSVGGFDRGNHGILQGVVCGSSSLLRNLSFGTKYLLGALPSHVEGVFNHYDRY